MAKKISAILIFLLLVFGVIYFLYHQGAKPVQAPTVDQTKSADQNQTSQTIAQPPAPQATSSQPSAATSSTPAKIDLGNRQLQGTFSAGEGDSNAPNISVVEVDFDGNQFTPASVDIHVNDWVFFKNKSSVDMWVASNPHPTHTDYPGFDSLKIIAPGSEYKFQFTKVGHWGYHDHLDPALGGVVNVSQ